MSHAPVRGAIALPLHDGLQGIGALDLYVFASDDVAAVDLRDASAVASEIASAFQMHSRPAGQRRDAPAWLDAPAARARSLVWQAMGFVNSGLGMSSTDALALLRAHAFALGQTLDDLAAAVVSRQLPVEEL